MNTQPDVSYIVLHLQLESVFHFIPNYIVFVDLKKRRRFGLVNTKRPPKYIDI